MQETQETQVQSLVWEDPLEKEVATHSSVLAGKIHRQRSLAGCSPCTTEHTHTDTHTPANELLESEVRLR